MRVIALPIATLAATRSTSSRAHSEAGYRLGSDCGSPNRGSTLLSKRVTAQIRSPLRVRTRRPTRSRPVPANLSPQFRRSFSGRERSF